MRWTSPSHDRLAYVIFGVLLSVEFLFFCRFAEREIIWAYPNHHDQVGYLFGTYELYTDFLNSGFGVWRRDPDYSTLSRDPVSGTRFLSLPSLRSYTIDLFGGKLHSLWGTARVSHVYPSMFDREYLVWVCRCGTAVESDLGFLRPGRAV